MNTEHRNRSNAEHRNLNVERRMCAANAVVISRAHPDVYREVI